MKDNVNVDNLSQFIKYDDACTSDLALLYLHFNIIQKVLYIYIITVSKNGSIISKILQNAYSMCVFSELQYINNFRQHLM